MKLEAEHVAKCKALERGEKAEHTISMLELDVKNAQEEITKLKTELKTNNMKVGVVCQCQYACACPCHYFSVCVCVSVCAFLHICDRMQAN